VESDHGKALIFEISKMTTEDSQSIQIAKDNKKENEIFLRKIKSIDTATFYNVLKATHTNVFAKTDCLTCANCCKTSPPLISKSDIKRIASFLNTTPKIFEREYVITDYNGEMSFPCRFLQDDNTCSIYDVRPEACRRYPHTDEKDYALRTKLNIENTIVCPAAVKILNQLKAIFPAL
jgi:uncharacterized protein